MRPAVLFRSFLLVCRANSGVQRRRLCRILYRILPLCVLIPALSGCSLYPSPSHGPAPAVSIVQAKDLGVVATNSDILGRDGGYSALFQGQSVWLYGDTFIAKPDALNRTLLSDSWSFTTNLNAQGGITGFQERLDSTGAPTMILPETPAEQAFNQAHNVNNCQAQPCGARWALWPSSIVVNPADNSALIFYMVVSASVQLSGHRNLRGHLAEFSAAAAAPNIEPTNRGRPSGPALHPGRAWFRFGLFHQQRHTLCLRMRLQQGMPTRQSRPIQRARSRGLEFLRRERPLVRANRRRRFGVQ